MKKCKEKKGAKKVLLKNEDKKEKKSDKQTKCKMIKISSIK